MVSPNRNAFKSLKRSKGADDLHIVQLMPPPPHHLSLQ